MPCGSSRQPFTNILAFNKLVSIWLEVLHELQLLSVLLQFGIDMGKWPRRAHVCFPMRRAFEPFEAQRSCLTLASGASRPYPMVAILREVENLKCADKRDDSKERCRVGLGERQRSFPRLSNRQLLNVEDKDSGSRRNLLLDFSTVDDEWRGVKLSTARIDPSGS